MRNDRNSASVRREIRGGGGVPAKPDNDLRTPSLHHQTGGADSVVKSLRQLQQLSIQAS